MADKTPIPHINSLVPNEVPVNWEGTLNIYGSNFDKDGFPLIDGAAPAFVFNSTALLTVTITKTVTGVSGKKLVEVHSGEGDLSNQVVWTVESRKAMKAAE